MYTINKYLLAAAATAIFACDGAKCSAPVPTQRSTESESKDLSPICDQVALLKQMQAEVQKCSWLSDSCKELCLQFPMDKAQDILRIWNQNLTPVPVLTEEQQHNIVTAAKAKALDFFMRVLPESASELREQAKKAIESGHYTFCSVPAEAFANSHTRENPPDLEVNRDEASDHTESAAAAAASIVDDIPASVPADVASVATPATYSEIFCKYYDENRLLCTIVHEVGHVLDNRTQVNKPSEKTSEHVSIFFEQLLYSSEYGKAMLKDYNFKAQRALQVLLDLLLANFVHEFREDCISHKDSICTSEAPIDCETIRQWPSVLRYSQTQAAGRESVIDFLGIREAVMLTIADHYYYQNIPQGITQKVEDLTAEELQKLNNAIAKTPADSDERRVLEQLRDGDKSLADCSFYPNLNEFITFGSGSYTMDLKERTITFTPGDVLIVKTSIDTDISAIVSKRASILKKQEFDTYMINMLLGNLVLGFCNGTTDEKVNFNQATAHVQGYYYSLQTLISTGSIEKVNSGRCIDIDEVMRRLTSDSSEPTRDGIIAMYQSLFGKD